jgi:hypothetical protein
MWDGTHSHSHLGPLPTSAGIKFALTLSSRGPCTPLQGLPKDGLRRIILTASGGAFRDWPVEKLKDVTVQQATTHPNWSMGKKITIDSATLMNKGEWVRWCAASWTITQRW